MNRAEYLQAMRDVRKTQAKVEQEQAKLIKTAYLELLAPFVKAFRDGINIPINKTELSLRLMDIIKTHSVKPAQEAVEVHQEFKKSLFNRLGIDPPPPPASPPLAFSQTPIPERIAPTVRKIENAIESFKAKIYKGTAFATQGISGYRRDAHGHLVWDNKPFSYVFRKKFNLSERVWAAVNENEQAIFKMVREGRARGRDIKDIAKDLEIYITDSNRGGERVMGRWGKLKPAGLPADADLRTKYYRDLKQQGLLTLTPAQKAYRARFGKAGIDYRTLRIMRT